MIRILVIDDAETPEFLEGMAREIAGGFRTNVDHHHLNPASAFQGGDADAETAKLIANVGVCAAEFWDLALIDINLNDLDRPEAERLDLSLSIAETFREHNKAAVVMLYSGTLAKHIPKLIQEDGSSQKKDSEKALKRIFEAGIAGFVPRDELRQRVYSALEEPPPLLAIDRLLTRNSALSCKVEESEFRGRSFLELAAAVRRHDKLGKRVAELVVEFGIANLVELNG